MKNLAASTALVILALGSASVFQSATPALAQEAHACSDFGLEDARNDHVLSEVEYAAWEGAFDYWDDDGDELISEAEFDTCIEAGGWHEVAELDPSWKDDAHGMFVAWDDDGDGFLIKTEFADEQEFDEWDANDDGLLDDQEFLIHGFLF